MGLFDFLIPGAKSMDYLFENLNIVVSDFKTDNRFWSCDFNSAVLVDNSMKKIVLYNYSISDFMSEKIKVYNYRDILYSEIIEDGNSVTKTQRMSQVGSALVGGILAGGLGFLVGGLTGKKKNINTIANVSVNIAVKNISNPLFTITFLNKETEKNDKHYKCAIKEAQELHAVISTLIDFADREDEKEALSNASTTSATSAFGAVSVADELFKLTQLLEKGVITQEEFNTLKASIISKLSISG